MSACPFCNSFAQTQTLPYFKFSCGTTTFAKSGITQQSEECRQNCKRGREAILQEARTGGFDGATYSHELDGARLTGLMGKVFDIVKNGHWYSLQTLAEDTGGSEGGCAARLRDLRKERFGGFDVERKRGLTPGVHWYRLRGRTLTPELARELLNRPAFDELKPRQKSAEERLQLAVAALHKIRAGEGAPRTGSQPFPLWAQMQALARITLQEMGE